jgi:hypothetical protein
MPDHPVEMICTATGKIMYESRKAAREAAINFKRRKVNRSYSKRYRRSDRVLEAYQCEHCSLFHTGHRRKEKTRAGFGRKSHHSAGKPLWAKKRKR